jgi:hypothetical protein
LLRQRRCRISSRKIAEFKKPREEMAMTGRGIALQLMAIFLLLAASGRAFAQPTTSPLDGRLGGTVASFQAAYGPPLPASDMDWSVTQAHEIALGFLPVDVTCQQMPARSIRMVCSSASLAAEVPASVYAYGDLEFSVGQASYYIAMNADSSGVEWIAIGLRDDL